MEGTLERFDLEGRSCACFCPRESGGSLLPSAVLCGWELERLLPVLADGLPPMLLFFAGADGDRDFTPWPAPGVREGEHFTGGAGGYLAFLMETALPYMTERFNADPSPERSALLGYSLGGLFALWSLGQTDRFSVAASLSGSLWYEGFGDYLRSHPPKETARVYLSLGDREEFGGPPVLRSVGNCTRAAAAFYRERLADTVLEWNKGGHGKGVEARWRKGLQWAAARVSTSEGCRKEGERHEAADIF